MNRIIRIKGTGSMVYRPDLVEIIITLKSADESYKVAMRYHCEKIGKLIDCMDELCLDSTELRTIGLTTDTIDDFNTGLDSERYCKKGTEITQKFKIEMPFDIVEIERAVHGILKCDISAEILLVQTVSDIETLKAKILEKAVCESKKKAKAMAKAVGAKLGDVVQIEYKQKDIECKGYISQDFFDNDFVPITTGILFDKNFMPEMEIEDEVEVVWKLE